jgi:hypothetical protein
VTDEGLRRVASLNKLTELSLYECQFVTDVGLRHLSHLHNLRKLNLTGCETSQAAEAELRWRVPGLLIEHELSSDEDSDAESTAPSSTSL